MVSPDYEPKHNLNVALPPEDLERIQRAVREGYGSAANEVELSEEGHAVIDRVLSLDTDVVFRRIVTYERLGRE